MATLRTLRFRYHVLDFVRMISDERVSAQIRAKLKV
jgi:hypothetical protein